MCRNCATTSFRSRRLCMISDAVFTIYIYDSVKELDWNQSRDMILMINTFGKLIYIMRINIYYIKSYIIFVMLYLQFQFNWEIQMKFDLKNDLSFIFLNSVINSWEKFIYIGMLIVLQHFSEDLR